jgi:hypothetical protein
MRRPRMVCVCQREGQADVVWCACACGAVVVAGESSTHRMPASVLRQDHHKRGGGYTRPRARWQGVGAVSGALAQRGGRGRECGAAGKGACTK